MNENNETNTIKDAQINIEHDIYLENRQQQDLRSEPSKGYTYVSMVGWIDRRERLRRKDDPFNF
ncbi:MAG: hypothetical protein PVJ84_07680 [Desulfobacteraceae bacterium]